MARRRYVSAFHFASVCARLKRAEETFQWLERSYKERSTNLLFLKVDPNLENVRGDPRFAALVRRIGLPEAD